MVEASAGSGKTYCLAKRYVQLLLNPALHHDHVPIRNILAITFTNKAAFEMKARILDFLKRIALQSLPPNEAEDILAPIDINQTDASRKAFRIMEELIHNYNFFQVQTIDSFINALLSGCAFKIGLSANFKIKRNYLDYLEYSLDQLIDRAGQDKETYKVFAQFLHQYLFLENKPGWFPKKDMLSLIEALYQQSNTFGLDFIPFASPGKGEDLIVKKRKILTLMRELRAEIPAEVDSRFLKSLDSFLGKHDQTFDIDRVSDYFAREIIPVRKGSQVSSKTDRLWERIRKQLEHLSEREAYSLFNPYIAVFSRLMGEFHKKATKDDVLFLPELNRKARLLFDEGAITVEELYYRLATRFHHYLIDEFQDTSFLQWRNLFLLVEEALSTGGSLFYVGDKKQAVFGFRGGEVRLFDHVQESFKSFNVQTEQLGKNYRSRRSIVEFNNRVFSIENLTRFIKEVEKQKKGGLIFSPEDFKEVENIFHSSRQTCHFTEEGGYVRIEYEASKQKQDRDEAIRERLVKLIKEVKPRFSCRQIAVLTRSNDEIEQITSWLMEEGISVESERTLNIKENPIVQDLISFLQFLNSPIDNVAFTTFILSDVFTKAAGIKKEDLHRFVFGLRKRLSEEKDIYIYKEFRSTYEQAWDQFIDEFFKNVGLYPLYELMISIVSRLAVLTHFPHQQGFVMRFLEAIKEQEEENTDIASFLENFEALESEDLYVNVSDSDSIKVMTIHKAKGLEFPVVIIPFLGATIRVGSGGGLGQQSYLMDFQQDHLALLRIKSKYLKFSEKLSEIWHKEYVKAFLSELNNIYVALTRAESELYAFIPKKSGSSNNILEWLIPEDALQMGKETVYEAGSKIRPKAQEPRVSLKLPAAQYHDWIDFLKDEFPDYGQVFHRDQIFKGDILHLILSFIGNTHEQDKEQLLSEAVNQARRQYPQVEDFTEYEKTLKKALERDSLKQFFDVVKGEVFQEIDVVDPFGRTKRLDRLIVLDEEAWIVDYKSSRDDTGMYQKQVSEYIDIVKGIYPQKKVKGYLIYLDEFTAEEVKVP